MIQGPTGDLDLKVHVMPGASSALTRVGGEHRAAKVYGRLKREELPVRDQTGLLVLESGILEHIMNAIDCLQ